MTTRFHLILLVSACCLASAAASAQVQNESTSSLAPTGQVFDVARVDNTLYVAGPAGLGVALGDGGEEPFILLDPPTGAPAGETIVMSAPRDGVNTAIADGAGGWYVGGTFNRISNGGGGGCSGLAHLTPPGVDMTFRPAVNGIVNGLSRARLTSPMPPAPRGATTS